MTGLEEALEQLEALGRRIESAGGGDAARLTALVQERAALMERLGGLLEERGGDVDRATLARLEAVRASGAQLEEKLRLLRARLGHELGEMYRTSTLLRALCQRQEESPRVDVQV